MRVVKADKGSPYDAFLFVALLALLGFCVYSPDGIIGPKHRH